MNGETTEVDATVYVVDDDEGVRGSLAALLMTEGYKVESYASGKDFLQVVDAETAGCIVLDLRMPDMDGLEVQKRLNAQELGLPVIMVTGHGDIALAVGAMKAGAWDFVEKPYSELAILNSVRSAIDSHLASRQSVSGSESFMAKLEGLTGRERQVLERLVDGQSNKEIAQDLEISPRTVEIHRARVMEKLKVRNYADLIRSALRCGIGN